MTKPDTITGDQRSVLAKLAPLLQDLLECIAVTTAKRERSGTCKLLLFEGRILVACAKGNRSLETRRTEGGCGGQKLR